MGQNRYSHSKDKDYFELKYDALKHLTTLDVIILTILFGFYKLSKSDLQLEPTLVMTINIAVIFFVASLSSSFYLLWTIPRILSGYHISRWEWSSWIIFDLIAYFAFLFAIMALTILPALVSWVYNH